LAWRVAPSRRKDSGFGKLTTQKKKEQSLVLPPQRLLFRYLLRAEFTDISPNIVLEIVMRTDLDSEGRGRLALLDCFLSRSRPGQEIRSLRDMRARHLPSSWTRGPLRSFGSA
jgi:hypothetical protein